MTLLLACLIAFSFICLVTGLHAFTRKIRQNRLRHLTLRPNCLMTRHPIVFVSGQRSLFRPFEYWNDIPIYLKEHGYEVMVLQSPAASSRPCVSSEEFLAPVECIPGKIHLIGDSTSESQLRELAKTPNPKIATLTLAKNVKDKKSGFSTARKPAGPPDLADLRPLVATISTFDLQPVLPPSASADDLDLQRTIANYASVFLLKAHNLFALFRRARVDALETGQAISRSWSVESQFLELAISLAERDAQWSGEV
jgi:hypothetical protein